MQSFKFVLIQSELKGEVQKNSYFSCLFLKDQKNGKGMQWHGKLIIPPCQDQLHD